jgi:hypothetical protein
MNPKIKIIGKDGMAYLTFAFIINNNDKFGPYELDLLFLHHTKTI